MRLAIIAVICLSMVFAFSGEKSTKTFQGKSLQMLEVNNIEGEIEIIGHEGNEVTLTTTKEIFEEGCVLEEQFSASALSIAIKQESKLFGGSPRCRVHFKVMLPKKVMVDVSTISGNINITGLEARASLNSVSGNARATKFKGEATFNTVSGSLDIDGELAGIDANLVSGKMKARGLAGGADVKAVSGDLHLFFSKDPQQDLEIDTMSGNVHVYFPKGTKVRTEANSFSGKINNELKETKDAKTLVKMNSMSGNLSVKEN